MLDLLTQAGGSSKLESLLAHDTEEAAPEFLRQRPKYYYYNQWMRDRIVEHCGRNLPEPVVAKMLDMEAGELDLILNYPTAAQQQVCGASLGIVPRTLVALVEGQQDAQQLSHINATQLAHHSSMPATTARVSQQRAAWCTAITRL